MSARERGRLGLPEGVGLRVDAVGEGSPAAEAGLKVGEVLEQLGEQVLVNTEQFRTLVRNLAPGAKVELKARGEAGPRRVQAVVGGREAAAAGEGGLRPLAPPAWVPGELRGRFDGDFEFELPPPMWLDGPDVFIQPFEGLELSPELEKRFNEARERMREAQQAMRQAMQDHVKAGRATAQAQASQRVGSFSDGEHTLTLKVTPQGRLLAALLGFNLGVELGQLAIVALYFAATALAARTVSVGARSTLRDLANATVCGLGVYWWVARAYAG